MDSSIALLDGIIYIFSETKVDLSGVTSFDYDEKLYNDYICTAEKRDAAWMNIELKHNVEHAVRLWNKTIEKVCLY